MFQVTPKKANDMMIVGRLQKCEQKTNNQELLLHGPMLCAEGINFVERSGNASNKPRELQVFLFEQIIIFADIVGKKTTFVNPSYIYKNHIQVTFLFVTRTIHQHSQKAFTHFLYSWNL